MTSAERQRLTVRAMWFAMNVVDLRGRARFLEAHPAVDTGESPAGYAMTAREFERATRELANQVIAGQQPEAAAP